MFGIEYIISASTEKPKDLIGEDETECNKDDADNERNDGATTNGAVGVLSIFAPLANREEDSSTIAEHAGKSNRDESKREDDGSRGITNGAEAFGGAVTDEDLVDNVIK